MDSTIQLRGLTLQRETAELRPYGGHHVPAKGAFAGAQGYDLNKALAIPSAELARLGIKHPVVTGNQMRGYRAFAKKNKPLSWEVVAKIESDALIAGGMTRDMATETVKQAISALQHAGIVAPTRIPWGGI